MTDLVSEKSHKFRKQLLTTVSALAFFGSIYASEDAIAAERPSVWIELGGQLERMKASQDAFAPPFVADVVSNPFTSPSDFQKLARYTTGYQAKVLVEPEGSNWTFSAAILYGRSNNNKKVHQDLPLSTTKIVQSIPTLGIYRTFPISVGVARFSNTVARNDESHTVLDFRAGRDVGVGMFGSSQVSLGVRFAQFGSRSSATLNAVPDFEIVPHTSTFEIYYQSQYVFLNIKRPHQRWHHAYATSDLSRSFSGVGPSISWDFSLPLGDESRDGIFSIDGGANAAVLFGRQKVRGHHETREQYKSTAIVYPPFPSVYNHSYSLDRARSVVVPNVGGFAGVSLNWSNAKISLGYRADFFFGAIDGGVDVRKTYDRDFYGPFATMSIGLGG